jgi:hypothetical protein
MSLGIQFVKFEFQLLPQSRVSAHKSIDITHFAEIIHDAENDLCGKRLEGHGCLLERSS